MLSRPTTTIITAVLNGVAHLEQCIRSVQEQELLGVEHIVIDGGSTDGTLDIIQRHAHHLSYWQSEPDSGIADAMNKGIAKAQGEWLLFLQSDDYLYDSTILMQALGLFDKTADIQAFPVLFGGLSTPVLKRVRGANFWLNFKTGFNHQGTFIRRALFDRIGLYDSQFKIAMDYEFFLRAYRKDARFAYCRTPALSVMRDTGISSQRDWPHLQQRFTEEMHVHKKHQKPSMAPLYAVYWTLYPCYRWALSILER